MGMSGDPVYDAPEIMHFALLGMTIKISKE